MSLLHVGGVDVTLVDLLLVLLGVTLLPGLWRMALGPSDVDRALAADHVFFVFVAAVGLLAVRLELPALLDVVVVATLIGFLATVTLARLVDRGEP